MSAQLLRDQLVSAGLKVREDPGWTTRGNVWRRRKPVAVMQHHTSLPVPYPISRLNGSGDNRVKCNMNTKPDGTVWLVAYNACNYSSGPGSSVVLDEIQRGIVPQANAKQRGLIDDVAGNPYYWNFENDHEGDGSPLPLVQLEAIVLSTVVVLQHFELQSNRVISHAEHTRRKVDPYWNGSNRTAINQIRELVQEANMPSYRTVKNVPDADWAREVVDWGIATGLIVISDDSPDDWNRGLTDGRYWTFEYRRRDTGNTSQLVTPEDIDVKINVHAANADAHHD